MDVCISLHVHVHPGLHLGEWMSLYVGKGKAENSDMTGHILVVYTVLIGH